ncbi:MAG: cation diffusion facilitator family transporter [Acidobacteriota bacterium]
MAGRKSYTYIYVALIGNGLIAIAKFIAAALTGSSAMIAEGIHSVVDTSNQGLMLLGVKLSQRPADPGHPFGHGKEVYFWSFVVAILIFAVGSGISIYEGVIHLMHPGELESPLTNYIVLAIAFVFETIATSFAYKKFRKEKGSLGYIAAVQRSKDPTVFVVLFEDAAALTGIVVASVGVFLVQVTGNPYFDAVSSLIIGLILAGVAIWLAYETRGLLLGESANQPVVEKIRKAVESQPGVDRINKVMTMHMGPEHVLVILSLDFTEGQSAAEVEAAAAAVEQKLREAEHAIKWVFIEAEDLQRAKAAHIEPRISRIDAD